MGALVSIGDCLVSTGGGFRAAGRCMGGASADVLFFPDRAMPCRNYLEGRPCRRPNCGFAHEPTSLYRLLCELRQARTSLDICVFTITCNEIAAEVEAAGLTAVGLALAEAEEPLPPLPTARPRLLRLRLKQFVGGRNLSSSSKDNDPLDGSARWQSASVLAVAVVPPPTTT